MTQANELRKQVACYTSGSWTVERFRDWFLPVLRDAHSSANLEFARLADAVEWEFVDYQRGATSELQLKENLGRVAEVAVADVPESRAHAAFVQRQHFFGAQPGLHVFVLSSGNRDSVAPQPTLESYKKSFVQVSELEVTAG